MQDQAAQQVSKALREANNVMVTVRNSPSVDELTAAVALTLMLNHMNKHATTVFSGVVPSTIEFLQPEMAIESNTDSLRDFIISLDKSKADKLRYKVEDNVVRIFITPYKTSISEHDLEFSQGDFNVDVVIALGVVGREDYDQAVSTHGRILHDATIVGVTNKQSPSQIGAINWHDPQASSVSEMIASIAQDLGNNVLDGQISTALLTGIVAETDRFKNSKTTPKVLSLSSLLMSFGANQQLIAEQLEHVPPVVPIVEQPDKVEGSDGTLEIDHNKNEVQNIHIDDHGNLGVHDEQPTLQAPPPPMPPDQMPLQPSQPNLNNLPNGAYDIPGEVPPEIPQEITDSADELEEEPQPEPPPREYITEPAKSAAPDIEQKSGGLTDGLYNQNSIKTEEGPVLPSAESSINTTLEHRHKVIQPLSHENDQNEIPSQVPGTPAITSQPTSSTVREMIAPKDEITAVDTKPIKDDQTLVDLEQAVGATTKRSVSTSSNLEEHTGSIRKPAEEEQTAPETPVLPPTEEKKVAEIIASEVGQAKKSEENNKPAPEPPKVISPKTAPSVPPPIVPPEPSSQPQFYEADGSKSDSKLNPTEK